MATPKNGIINKTHSHIFHPMAYTNHILWTCRQETPIEYVLANKILEIYDR